MTNSLTGIDIRKTLLANNMRPSDYDEQAIYNHLMALATKPVSLDAILEAAEKFKKKKD